LPALIVSVLPAAAGPAAVHHHAVFPSFDGCGHGQRRRLFTNGPMWS